MTVDWDKVNRQVAKWREEQLDEFLEWKSRGEDEEEVAVDEGDDCNEYCDWCLGSYSLGQLTSAIVKEQGEDGKPMVTSEMHLCNGCYKSLKDEGKI